MAEGMPVTSRPKGGAHAGLRDGKARVREFV
jgi:hypothetical protein